MNGGDDGVGDDLERLQKDALQLVELDQNVVRAAAEGKMEEFFQLLCNFAELRKGIKTRMLAHPTIMAPDPEAAVILRKIGSGERWLPSDEFLKRIEAGSKEEAVFGELDSDDLSELQEDLFHVWFSGYEYVSALNELRPLILRRAASESVVRLVREVKDCYAFQQYDAAYSMCRTLLEASIRDICVRRALLPDLGENIVLLENYKWHELRNKVSTGQLRERLKELYGRLCEVLHARRPANAEEARTAIGETLGVIEELYETHGL